MKAPFENVVAEHGATVLRVCRVVLGPDDADDAWSETFLSAMRAYPDLPETANVEAWLVTIAHRKAIDVLRATGRRPLPTETAGGTDRARRAGRRRPDLWTSVRHLPDKQRQAVAYHYLAGLPYAEIARILGGTRRRGPARRRRRHQEPAQQLSRTQDTRRRRSHERRPTPRHRHRHCSRAPVDAATLSGCTGGWRPGRTRRAPRRRLPHRRLTRRAAAARGDRAGPGPGRLRQRGPRPGPRRARAGAQPSHPARTAAARRGRRAKSTSTSRGAAPGSTSRWTFRCPTGSGSWCRTTCREIGYGHTPSYAQVAELVGNPRAVRAVGTACATNPLPIVVPCHRVLRTDGSLGGYVGGAEAKTALLRWRRRDAG